MICDTFSKAPIEAVGLVNVVCFDVANDEAVGLANGERVIAATVEVVGLANSGAIVIALDNNIKNLKNEDGSYTNLISLIEKCIDVGKYNIARCQNLSGSQSNQKCRFY